MGNNIFTKILVFIVLVAECNSLYSDDFTYNGENGPEHWAENFNTCQGKFQSPINIDLHVVKTRFFPKINLTNFMSQPKEAVLKNNGHTVIIKLKFNNYIWPIVSDGPLPIFTKYRFAQLHFHWGANDSIGSEDRINNQTFPAELHMVFYDDQYRNLTEALFKPYAVAVFAFFFAFQKSDNENFGSFFYSLKQVQEPFTEVHLAEPPALKNFLPHDTDTYFTYTGSLTTPPCSEEVTWLDFNESLKISKNQLNAFRQLLNKDGLPMTHNYRPLQPLNSRSIFQNVIRNEENVPDLTVPFFELVGSDKNGKVPNLSTSSHLINIYLLILIAYTYFASICYYHN